MNTEALYERYLPCLLDGRRTECRQMVLRALEDGAGAGDLLNEVIQPAMQQVSALLKRDEINLATEHMASRINRMLADQLSPHLPRRDRRDKRVLITCADGEPEELGAQMTADQFEADGWDVYFTGGGVPNDEILQIVGQLRPDILLIVGTQPSGVPNVRKLIDLIRSVGSNPTMNILISGGVFNRAEGLWEEINADLFAPTAPEALAIANSARPKDPVVTIPGPPPKKRRRRRKPPLLMVAEQATPPTQTP